MVDSYYALKMIRASASSAAVYSPDHSWYNWDLISGSTTGGVTTTEKTVDVTVENGKPLFLDSALETDAVKHKDKAASASFSPTMKTGYGTDREKTVCYFTVSFPNFDEISRFVGEYFSMYVGVTLESTAGFLKDFEYEVDVGSILAKSALMWASRNAVEDYSIRMVRMVGGVLLPFASGKWTVKFKTTTERIAPIASQHESYTVNVTLTMHSLSGYFRPTIATPVHRPLPLPYHRPRLLALPWDKPISNNTRWKKWHPIEAFYNPDLFEPLSDFHSFCFV